MCSHEINPEWKSELCVFELNVCLSARGLCVFWLFLTFDQSWKKKKWRQSTEKRSVSSSYDSSLCLSQHALGFLEVSPQFLQRILIFFFFFCWNISATVGHVAAL